MQRLHTIQAQLLRQAVADGGPLGERFAVAIVNPQRQAIRVLDHQGQESQRQVSPAAWGLIWPIFQVAKRVSGQDATNGNRWLIAANGEAVWLCRPDELGAALTPVSPDRTDDGVAPELRPNDSLGIVPLKGRTFDPVLIYGKQLPPGVNFIGVEDQEGVLAIIDGPNNPGSPLPNARTREFLRPLLDEALSIQGAGGLVISMSTRQCWAVSAAALESIIARQAMPVTRKRSELDSFHDAMAAIPNGIHGVYGRARQMAADPRPAPRAFVFTGFVLAVTASLFFGALIRKLTIDPHMGFIERTPGLNALAQDQFQATVLGASITLGLLAACGPMILQFLGLIFSKAHTWALYLFWGASAYDIGVNMQFWRAVFWPAGFDGIYAQHGQAAGVGAEIGAIIFSGLVAFTTSVGSEWALLALLALVAALAPGAAAAVGMAVNQVFVRTPIDLYYAARNTATSNQHYLDTRRTQQAELPVGEPFVWVVDSPEVIVHGQESVKQP